MKSKILFTIMLPFMFFNSMVHGQLLSKTFLKNDSVSNLTYKMTIKEKDLFSEEVYKDTLKVSFAVTNNKNLFKIIGTKNGEIYDGSKLIKMNLDNSTYTMESSSDGSVFQRNTLSYLIGLLKQDVTENKPIQLLKDSIISGKTFYNIKITEIDTVKKNKHVYSTLQVLIDKESHLPVYLRKEQQGFVDGTDMFVDTYADIYFYDYQLNKSEFSNLSTFTIPNKFIIQKPKESKPLLVMGTKAPELYLKDSDENAFQLKSQRGKVVLLNFTTNSCPHGIESISMLNKLYSKYSHKNFSIVTINPYDKEAIEMYNKRGNVKYPVFISVGSQNEGNYNVESLPTFYLIDKTGNIIKGFSGYYESLDEEINNIIKKHL